MSNDIIFNRKYKEINIESFDDLCIYLDMYRYLNIDDFLKKILYIYVKNNEIDINYLKQNFHELDIIEEFQYILSFNNESCNFAAENNRLDLLKFLHENGCPWNIDTTLGAAENGHLECLRYAIENGCAQ